MKILTLNFQEMLTVFRKFYQAAGVALEDATLVVWCDGNYLHFIAYYGRVWLVWRTDYPGEALCDVAQLRNLALLELEDATTATVEMAVEKKRILLEFRNAHLEIPTNRGGVAPELDYELEMVWGPGFNWHMYVISDYLRHLRPAMGTDPKRPHLRAWALTGEEAIATDGHRLHLVKLGCALPAEKKIVALPPMALAALADLESANVLEVSLGERYFCAASPDMRWSLFAELSSTPFPNWERVVPESPLTFELEVPAVEFLAAVRYMLSFGLPCNLFFKGEQLELQPLAGSGIWGVATIPYKRVSGERPSSMCLNPAYLIDALANMDDDVVTVRGTDSDGALVLESGELSAIVMPMRR